MKRFPDFDLSFLKVNNNMDLSNFDFGLMNNIDLVILQHYLEEPRIIQPTNKKILIKYGLNFENLNKGIPPTSYIIVNDIKSEK